MEKNGENGENGEKWRKMEKNRETIILIYINIKGGKNNIKLINIIVL